MRAYQYWDESYSYIIECHNCYLDMGEFDTEEEAVKRWNRRAND